MATLDHRLTTVLTATPQSISLDVDDPYTLYLLKTSGTISILGTTNISTTGTLIEGLTFKFQYTGSIIDGTLSIMGENLPTHLKQKNCTIVAYYNGSTWEVSFVPSLSQTAIITPDNFTEAAGGSFLVRNSVGAELKSSNVEGTQILDSVTIPSNVDKLKAYRITIQGSFLNTASKEIKVIVTNSDADRVIFDSGAITNSGFFTIYIEIPISSLGEYVSYATLASGDGGVIKTQISGTEWDIAKSQVLRFETIETTPAGNLVTLNNITVEKISE